jgi:Uncharacterized protein conserved in bacteria (DUF2188)
MSKVNKIFIIMPRKERYIVINPDPGGWDSKRENTEKISKHFGTKKEAMDWSREKAKEESSELNQHKIGLMQMILSGKKRLKI